MISDNDFLNWAEQAIDELPDEFFNSINNLNIEISDEKPPRPGVLGTYIGLPISMRRHNYGTVLPDRIIIYKISLKSLCGENEEFLKSEIKHVVLHEIAHHFGISDDRLKSLGIY